MEERAAMLTRYKIYRGTRPASDPLPDGVRQDTRKHTRHCLRPTSQIVERYLASPTDRAWTRFEREYRAVLDRRLRDDRSPFDELAELAMREDVYIGCNCPTKKNPNVGRCHTVLALRFIKENYPHLDVVLPRS